MYRTEIFLTIPITSVSELSLKKSISIITAENADGPMILLCSTHFGKTSVRSDNNSNLYWLIQLSLPRNIINSKTSAYYQNNK